MCVWQRQRQHCESHLQGTQLVEASALDNLDHVGRHKGSNARDEHVVQLGRQHNLCECPHPQCVRCSELTRLAITCMQTHTQRASSCDCHTRNGVNTPRRPGNSSPLNTSNACTSCAVCAHSGGALVSVSTTQQSQGATQALCRYLIAGILLLCELKVDGGSRPLHGCHNASQPWRQ